MKSSSIFALAAGTCLATGLLSGAAQAFTPHEIYDAKGNTVFELRFYNPEDGAFGFDDAASTWTFNQTTIDAVSLAAQYWADILKIAPGGTPAILNVGTEDRANASAGSATANDEDGASTLVGAALNNQRSDLDNLVHDAHGNMTVGKMNWSSTPFIPSQLPLSRDIDMTNVFIHEVAHALGISANAEVYDAPDSKFGIIFPSTINAWTSHLIDQDGKLAAPHQVIICNLCALPDSDDDTFDISDGFAYFAGSNVADVLNGAMQGIPVRLDSPMQPGSLDDVFSHSELKNSMMSHQNFRNYNTLMEAEFAALQDIGYTIDRRNLFGYSIYNDGVTLINDNPFFARNNEGTAYIANTYNMATMGLGLHVYGSNNRVAQRADILSAGAGGGGIRVDGGNNDLTIVPGTRVYANGANARGIMFAYGKDHRFTQRGDVAALGDNGIAVSFDFGHNAMGDDTESRGSYFVTAKGVDLSILAPDYYQTAFNEVNGPLVTAFDLTGSVAGQKAAIYVSDNAHIGAINVMQGAAISGDIISEYNAVDTNGNQRITALNFGLKADADGRSTAVADDNFSIAYAGNISGIDNLSLLAAGGVTQLTGDHELYAASIAQGATLSGKGNYLINTNGTFTNNGTLAPSLAGQAITIEGAYDQSATGTLQLSFNNNHDISRLIVDGQATLNGTIAFAPDRGWYQGGFSVTSDQWFDADTTSGAFTNVSITLASPTLTSSIFDNGGGNYTVTLDRASSAYSHYSDTSNGEAVGLALDGVADNASAGLQSLIAALDFSASDGSTIRAALPQLTGEAYASTSGTLINMSSATRSAVNSRLQQAFGTTPASTVAVMGFGPDQNSAAKQPSAIDLVAPATLSVSKDDLTRYAAWASAFGSWSSQSGDGNAARSKSTLGGFVSGIDASVHDNWRLGVMAGYSRSTFKTTQRASSGSSDNYTLGAYTGTEWTAPYGAIGFRSGLAYTWHSLEMGRSVAFPDFTDSLSADYNSGTFQIFGELGYKMNVTQRSTIEPYANLAYIHLRTDGFTEQGRNGAALNVQSDTMDTTLSTLGMRASTELHLGAMRTTARLDLGWRHAFGDINPTTTASFAAGSSLFTVAGNAIGKDAALIAAGLDFELSKSTTLGVAYQGQYGSGLTQNGINADLRVKF